MNNKYAQDMEAALDRVTAERDAARARVAELESDEPEWSAMQQKLGDANIELQQDLNQRDEQIATLDLQREAHLRNSQVAERRVGVLEGFLRKVVKRTRWHGDPLKDEVDAALKPAEGGGDESAHDRAYRNGLMQGYNLAINGSEKEYQDAVARYSGGKNAE